MSATNLDTLHSNIIDNKLWPYFEKNGDAHSVSQVCRTMSAAYTRFLMRLRVSILKEAADNGSNLYTLILPLADERSAKREDLVQFHQSIKSKIRSLGHTYPKKRVLSPQEVRLCSDKIENESARALFVQVYKQNSMMLFDSTVDEMRSLMRQNPSLLQGIRRLDLNKSRLLCLSMEIELFVNLEELYLDNNELVTLPLTLARLVNLQYLCLHNNKFTIVPKVLSQIENVKSLCITGLVTFPPTIGKLMQQTEGNYTPSV